MATAPNPLTEAVYTALADYIAQYGMSPSAHDLRGILGWTVISQVQYHLRKLEAEGRITSRPGVARSFRLTPPAPVTTTEVQS